MTGTDPSVSPDASVNPDAPTGPATPTDPNASVDPRVLGPGLAPTPFTAHEIRAGCRDGHRVLVCTMRGDAVSHHASGFEGGDAEGVTTTSVETDARGRPSGPLRRTRVAWSELQAHAAFPAERTTVVPERIRLAFGERDCLRYDVVGEDGTTTTFWFALAHPGMPVRYRTPDALVEVIAIG